MTRITALAGIPIHCYKRMNRFSFGLDTVALLYAQGLNPTFGGVERAVSIYILPIALTAFAIALVAWRLNQRDTEKLARDLKAAQDLAVQRGKRARSGAREGFPPPLRRSRTE